MKRKTLLFAVCLALVALPAGAADWLQFRGPHSSGVSEEKDLPVKWSDKENLVWKVELPGPGGSSPVVVGDKVFLTCYTGYGLPGDGGGDQKDLKRHLLCIDRKKGTVLWDKAIKAKLPESNYDGYLALHGYASSTPVTDGKQVYVFFGKTGVFAFDFDGKQLWQQDVGSKTHGWGSATSPLLYKNLVIVNASVESGNLVALNKKDGTKEWTCGGTNGSWDSPVLVDVPGGKQELVLRVPRSIVGIDPNTGKKLWQCGGFSDSYVCPSVVAKGGVVYASGGRFQGVAAAVKAGGKGDVSDTHKVWSQRQGGPIPSPAVYGDYLYSVNDGGAATCYNLKDGKKVYSERLKNSGTLYASITIADGKIYAVSRERGTFVLATPKLELLAHNTFESDRSIFNGSPVVSDGQLFLRSDKCLYCIGKK